MGPWAQFLKGHPLTSFYLLLFPPHPPHATLLIICIHLHAGLEGPQHC